MNWTFAYKVGFHPWEDAASDELFVQKFNELIDREETARQVPGKALDLGTGSGIWGVALAKRGWTVTGVDIVDQALHRARSRAADAGVEMRLRHGSVTALENAGVGTGYDLVLDTGTFHDLTEEQRKAMGRGVSEVTSQDATVLLLVWPKRIRLPVVRGANRAEVQDAFPGWEITNVEASHFRMPLPLQLLIRPGEEWYRLRRSDGNAA